MSDLEVFSNYLLENSRIRAQQECRALEIGANLFSSIFGSGDSYGSSVREDPDASVQKQIASVGRCSFTMPSSISSTPFAADPMRMRILMPLESFSLSSAKLEHS